MTAVTKTLAAPALLTSGSYLGTLAAVRELGRQGIPVTLADTPGRTLSARSKYVSRTLRTPPVSDPSRWVEWMLAFGRREPGHVLFATSDSNCWLFDAHSADFKGHFQTYLPPAGVLYELLDKARLHKHCKALAIDQPEQWSATDALDRADTLPFPVLVKPRTQCGLHASPKAIICANAAELRGRLQEAARTYAYLPEMEAHHPEVARPLVQSFHPESAHGVYSLAGFYAPERNAMLVRGSQKVLQHPWRVGVGLCFESRVARPHLVEELRRLFDSVGYRGPFEVEYVQVGERYLLIDVNPRFYGQMGFESSRGLPIAQLSHAAATANWQRFDELAGMAAVMPPDAPQHYRSAWMLRLYVTTHLAAGNLSLGQWRSWLEWSDTPIATDSIFADDDPAPAAQLRRDVAFSVFRSPRSTVRKYFFR